MYDCLINHVKIRNKILENITLSLNKENNNVFINAKSYSDLLKFDINSNIILDKKYIIKQLNVHGKNNINLNILNIKDLSNSHLECNFSTFYEKNKNDNKNCNLILNNIKFTHNNKLFEYDTDDIKVSTVNVLNQNGEKAIGKPKGAYITIDIKNLKIAGEEEIR